jgi:hypothetical protein
MGAKFGSYGVREAGRSDGFNDDRKEDVGARLTAMIAKNMADQKFIVGFNGADKSILLQSAARSNVKSLVKEWLQLLITHRKRIRT